MSKKTEKLNSLAQRYSACDEAVELVDIVQRANGLLLKKVRKVYPEGFQDEELIKAVTTINYDLQAIKSELQDLAMDLAEDTLEIRKEG